MAIRFYKPNPALRPYIRHFGHIRLSSSRADEPIHVDFFPNGSASLIVNLNADRDIYDRSLGEKFNTFFRFSGQFDGYRQLSCRELNLIFITFHPLGAYQLFRLPQDSFANLKIEIADVFPKLAAFCREIEDAAGNPTAVIHLLENWLLHRCLANDKKSAERVAQALKIIKETSGRLPISALCRETGMSISTLETHFKDKVGLTPKMFSRIERFNQCLHYIHRQQSVSWTELAYHFSYFDQMHFIREFKKFYGYTPGRNAVSTFNVSRLLQS